MCIPTLGSGGAEHVISILANQFADYGEEVNLILASENNSDNLFFEVSPKVHVIPLLLGKRKCHDPFKKIKYLRRRFKKLRPDIVISFLPHMDVMVHYALAGLGIPHVLSERQNPKDYPKASLLTLLSKHIFDIADGVVFQTEDVSEYYKGKIKGLQAVIYNPVNVKHIDIQGPVNKRFIAVGSFVKAKNYPCLLKAFSFFFKKHNDYTLTILGDGPQKADLIKLVTELHLNKAVSFPGRIKNWPETFRNSKAYILSSDSEGLPNALLEAMAAGFPCISSDCPIGAPRRFIKNGENGYLFPVGDAPALAEAMEKIISVKLKDDNKTLHALLNPKNIAKQWLSFLQKVIGRSQA